MAANMKEAKNTHCRWCSAPNCSNSKNKRPDLSFLRFPSDPKISRQWLINCRRKDLEDKTPEYLHNNCFICSEHFEPCCFSKTAVKRRVILRTAVPTIFNIPNPPPKLTPSRPPPKKRKIDDSAELPPETPFTSPTTPQCHPVTDVSETKEERQRKDRLKKKLCAQRSKNWRLQRKLSKMKESSPHQPNSCASTSSSVEPSSEQQPGTESSSLQASLESVEQTLRLYLPPQAVSFIVSQVRVGQLPKKSRRWSFQDKSFALSLFHASKKAYSLLQRLFQLPSPSTLALAMKNVQIEPGLCPNMLNLFQIKVEAMSPVERSCAIVYDEMAIKSDLSYDPSRDLVEGFEDYGLLLGRSRKPATHALVFMVKGLSTKWKQPFSYVLSNGPVKADMLLLVLVEVVKKVINLGLHPKAMVCDQGSNNRSALQKLGVSQSRPFVIIEHHKVYVLYDPPHLLKSIRNNLRNSGFRVAGDSISWDYIRQFYEMDSSKPIRLAPKLTSRHINMPVFANLRVSLAAQVLSHTVAAGIATMVFHSSLPQEALPTAHFIENFDQLFNAFNSRSLRSKGTMNNAMSAHSKHTTFLEQTKIWLEGVKPLNRTGSLPCLEGWKLSIEALLQLWQHLRDDCGFKFLLTSRLNQDCLENLFSIIRAKGGHRVNPTSREFRLALRQTMVDAVLVPGSNKNCKDDIDTFLFSFENMASMGAQSTVRTRLQQDVPLPLQQVMRAAPPMLTTTETNVLNYIGGYVGMKLRAKKHLLCENCKEDLIQARSTQDPSHTFICKKNFTTENEGLCAPSHKLMDILTAAEHAFRCHIDPYLYKRGLRTYLIRKVMEATLETGLECTKAVKQCDIHFLVINLFVNVRLHHHVRCEASQKQTSKSNKSIERKAATFQNK